MEVAVQLFAYLARYLPPHAKGRQAFVQLPLRADVKTLLMALGIPEEELGGEDYMPCVIIVNGEHVQPDAALHEGDRISIFPPLSGGGTPAQHLNCDRFWSNR